MVKQLISEIKKILPTTFVFLGGPEVSYNAGDVLCETGADCVVLGEGEKATSELIHCLLNQGELDSVNSLVFLNKSQLTYTSPAPSLAMDEVPFVYDDLSDLTHRIIYYESSRGCPFQCQYCLSGDDQQVRMRSLQEVYKHLDFFLSHQVRQVKFVDRTFNCNRQYALSIWRYLKEHDNNYTNFHFEIAAELLDEESLTFLPTVRKGLFQFEIGVQSTNPTTLKHIKRITKIDSLRSIIKRLRTSKNIHLHLDLIVGLPCEDYEQFGQSFNDVYALHPDQLQMGFLKLLKGSGLYQNKEQYGIMCSEFAPYEVLYTDVLPYQKLLKLKMMEALVETYYNSNRFQKTIGYLNTLFPTPFAMFEAFSSFYEQNQLHQCAHTNIEYYTIAHSFFISLGRGSEQAFQWFVKFDLYSHEKARKIPQWLTASLQEKYRSKVYALYNDPLFIKQYLPEYHEFDTKQIYRQAHIEVFPFDPFSGNQQETPILFNYRRCDLLGNAECLKLELLK